MLSASPAGGLDGPAPVYKEMRMNKNKTRPEISEARLLPKHDGIRG